VRATWWQDGRLRGADHRGSADAPAVSAPRKREANGEVDLLEPFENKGCGEIKHGP
jgi:hypothetical protein